MIPEGSTRLGAFVMTRNRPHFLMKTLQLLSSQSRPPDHILVIDNGPSEQTAAIVSAFSPSLVGYHAMHENVGPAGAAAYALERLSEEKYDWIYWGDDDDPPASSDTIERLMKVAETADANVGAVGAVGSKWDWDKGEIRRLPDHLLKGVLDVDMIAGNQQLIVRRNAVQDVGLPDARLFFGFEELEYCLRVRLAGYRLQVDGDLMREYRKNTGRLNWTPSRARVPRHSYDGIWRQYYSTRNYIFAMTRTFQHPQLARRETRKALARVACSWARGPKYGLAFTQLQLRAIVDGYTARMGRTVVPMPKYRNDLSATAPATADVLNSSIVSDRSKEPDASRAPHDERRAVRRNPKISVIVPTRNRPELLRQALLSVQAQDCDAFECIVVDDGSQDFTATEAVVRDLRDDRFRVLRSRIGPGLNVESASRFAKGLALNLGIEEATAEWLAFLDDDDLYAPYRLSRGLASLQTCPDMRFAVARNGHFSSKSPNWHSPSPIRLRKARNPLSEMMPHSSTWTVSRALAYDVGLFRPYGVLEDWEFYFKVAAVADIWRDEAVTVAIRRHNGVRENYGLQARIEMRRDLLRSGALRPTWGSRAFQLYRLSQLELLAGNKLRAAGAALQSLAPFPYPRYIRQVIRAAKHGLGV